MFRSSRFGTQFRTFFRDRRANVAVMSALSAPVAVCLAAVALVGTKASTMFNSIAGSL